MPNINSSTSHVMSNAVSNKSRGQICRKEYKKDKKYTSLPGGDLREMIATLILSLSLINLAKEGKKEALLGSGQKKSNT